MTEDKSENQPTHAQEDREFEVTTENTGPFELYLGFYNLLNKYGEIKAYSKKSRDDQGRPKYAIQVDFHAPAVQRENEDKGTTEEIVLKGQTDMYFARRPFDPTKLSLPFGSEIHLEIRKKGGEAAQKGGYDAYTHSVVLYPDKNIHTTGTEPHKPRTVGFGRHPGKLDEKQKTEVLLKTMQYLESVCQKSKKRKQIR